MKQLTVLVDDKVGLLANVSYLLGRSKINIESISVASVAGKAIINISVKDTKRAMDVLEANGYRCLETDNIVVRLANQPGELAKMTRLLADEKINLQQVTALSQDEKTSIYSLRVDKPAKAEKVLGTYLSLEGGA
ncbi:ACT domain protein [uncultured archaeon]|nr:ACT domain protein [uncultured archaeon]